MTDSHDQDPTVRASGDDSDTTDACGPKAGRKPSGRSVLRGQVLQPGSVIGRYEVVDVIDNGGMGVVYRARHTALGKMVALKVVSGSLQSDPRAMDRFLREMQAIGRLEAHPNVLNAYDAGDEEGFQYIATELIEGIQLGRLVKWMGPLSVPEASKIISQAALALEHLRKHELVHRDIKPSNLMLTRDGTVKVVDMGLALLRDGQAEQLTVFGETMGSIDYMAPEQWEDCHNVDWRSDVYSLGCTYYCLLAGRPPFCEHHRGSGARMRAHLTKEFPDIRENREDVPNEVLELLSGMTNKDPDRRLTDLVRISEQSSLIAAGDLKGLVERGFAHAKDQREAMPQSHPHRPKRIRTNNPIAVDAATQIDRTGAGTPAATTRQSSMLQRVALLFLAIGGAIGAIGAAAWVHFHRPNRNAAIAELRPLLDTSLSTAIATDDVDPDTLLTNPDAIGIRLSSLQPVSCVGHQAKVNDAVFLPNGKLASVSDDGVFCIFDLAQPETPLHHAKVADCGTVSIVFDPLAETLTLLCASGLLQICSAKDGGIEREVRLGDGVNSFDRVPGKEGVFVTTDWGGSVRRFELTGTGPKDTLIGRRKQAVYDVDVSADGAYMAWGGRDHEVTLFKVSEQSATDLLGHVDWVYDVDFSPDGKLIASAGKEGAVRLWQLPDGEPGEIIEHVVPQAVRFFPDNQHLAIGGRDGIVQVWDLKANRNVQTLSAGKPVDCIAVSADNRLLAAGLNDGTLLAWELALNPQAP